MADIFDEVSEELRQDQIKIFWKKNYKIITATIFFIIFLVVCYKSFFYFKEQRSIDNSKIFIDALSKIDTKPLKAENLFLKLVNINNNSDGYEILSLFALANIGSEFKVMPFSLLY